MQEFLKERAERIAKPPPKTIKYLGVYMLYDFTEIFRIWFKIATILADLSDFIFFVANFFVFTVNVAEHIGIVDVSEF